MFERVIFFLLIISLITTSYHLKKIAKLRIENEKLKKDVQAPHSLVSAMHEINVHLDSIDKYVKLASTGLNEGVVYDKFSERLCAVAEYVRRSQEKIANMEKELRYAKNEASAYLMMMDALKSELEFRVDEVETLESAVAQYERENQKLYQHVKHKDKAIEAKHNELQVLETKIHELIAHLKLTQANALFDQAKAVEETARKTFLAPAKREDTFKEALELYKKAFSFGKLEARQNIAELEKMLPEKVVMLTNNN